jgi:YHS domain-containing protein
MIETHAHTPVQSRSARTLRALPPVAISLFGAGVFLDSLRFKFTDHPKTQVIFSKLDAWAGSLGAPGLFAHTGLFSQYVIGAAELVAAILLVVGLLPGRARLNALGALIAAGVMTGAVGFHLFTPLGIDPNGDGGGLFAAAVALLLGSLTLLFIRRRELADLARPLLQGTPRRPVAMALIALALTGGALVQPTPAHAAKPPTWTPLGSNVALRGHDPVAYFTQGRPVRGDRAFRANWQGAEYHFASAANRDRFLAAPARFAPQYGGYCAWAVSQGYTAGIDPAAWAIVDGKLYLNYNADVQARWRGDTARHIAAADANWPRVLGR